MAVYDHEDQEQLDELKAWWKLYGNRVTNALLAIAVLVLAWQGWNWWQRNQAAQAAGVYGALQVAVSQQNTKAVRDLTGELVDKYPRTTYAGMGALLAAKSQIEGNDSKSARLQLTWAAENAKDDALRDLARLRLAAVLLDDKAYDEALAQLTKEPLPPFAPRLNELKGDVLVAQGKTDEARAAYQIALSKQEALQKEQAKESETGRSAYREILRIKLESVGGKPPIDGVKSATPDAGKDGVKS